MQHALAFRLFSGFEEPPFEGGFFMADEGSGQCNHPRYSRPCLREDRLPRETRKPGEGWIPAFVGMTKLRRGNDGRRRNR
uniref:Uncharacterized protein n=1 Tax=uncultured marine microorganism HF4000_APKG2J17 TaxID=455546 RepID=B3T6J7_9ZZZZ|nr:hypothetical protein ALOHA_HF4000APKG2J17ctg1g13 [uncultured marine microorganism HF4000_APKG2J17]